MATLKSWLDLLRPGGRIGLSSFGATDSGWTAAEAVLLKYAPAHLLDARTSGQLGPFASTASMTAMLQECGAVNVESRDEPLEVTLHGADHWHSWTMSLGLRQMWDAVPTHELRKVLDDIAAALEPDRGDDGLLHLTQQVRYTTAST